MALKFPWRTVNSLDLSKTQVLPLEVLRELLTKMEMRAAQNVFVCMHGLIIARVMLRKQTIFGLNWVR